VGDPVTELPPELLQRVAGVSVARDGAQPPTMASSAKSANTCR
jgi:hypothetical protein